MVDTLWENDGVACHNLHAHPVCIIALAHVEVARAARDVADLVLVMDVLFPLQLREKRLEWETVKEQMGMG